MLPHACSAINDARFAHTFRRRGACNVAHFMLSLSRVLQRVLVERAEKEFRSRAQANPRLCRRIAQISLVCMPSQRAESSPLCFRLWGKTLIGQGFCRVLTTLSGGVMPRAAPPLVRHDLGMTIAHPIPPFSSLIQGRSLYSDPSGMAIEPARRPALETAEKQQTDWPQPACLESDTSKDLQFAAQEACHST